MVYKCKICGGETTVDTQNGIAVCDYCGTKQALPLFTEESARLLYDRGNNYLMHNEYDKAEAVFTQLLTISPNASELYWDLVLCKYGVTYVCDPKTGKYIPTCNRTHYTSVFKDENYLKATGLASGEKLQLYKDDAATIDNIQKGILAVSKKEKPFDIFISYKETDASGNRTKDSVAAQRLYEKLTNAGYKVFFSRITLEDKIGTEYEPYIYAALHSSKVMLTLASSKENMEAAWVKNEWSRFLLLRQADASKTLLPLYFDMDKADLPDAFALFSAYDIKAEGFEEELVRGIKKLIPLPIMKAQKRRHIIQTVGIALGVLAVIAGALAAIIIPKELEKKRQQENTNILANDSGAVADDIEESPADETVVEITPEEKAYQEAIALFDNGEYAAAETAFTALGDYEDAAQMAEKCKVQPDYDAAMQLYYDGKYAQAAWAFDALGDYEDAADQKMKAEQSWRIDLASVVRDSWDDSRVYYISSNRMVVESFTGREEDIDSSHGNIVSHFDGIQLYEDGTAVSWGDEYENIIQIAPSHMELGKTMLHSDGTVSVGFLDSCSYDYLVSCYEEIKQWENIVQLSVYRAPKAGMAAFSEIATAGVDADGNVYLCAAMQPYSPWENNYTVKTFMDNPEAFKNVKMIDVSVGYNFGPGWHTDYFVNAAALTNDGKLVTYINGKTSVIDAPDIIDVNIDGEEVRTISSDGKLRSINSETVQLNDAVRFSDNYVITRSGAIYGMDGCKTYVYDEWLARMG